MPEPDASGGPTDDAPEGERVVTFLFTDIEDSTGHWIRLPSGMDRAHEEHDRLLRTTALDHGGHIFRTLGDAFCIAFPDAVLAVTAAVSAQVALQDLSLADQNVPLRVRMALHTGPAQAVDGDYRGLAPARASRLLEVVYGGQITLTAQTAAAAGDHLPEGASLVDLGTYRLRSFDTDDHLYQILHPTLPAQFPRLRSVADIPNNLPRQLTPFIGRERERAEVRHLVARSPLVTLTGAGGCGKTRLALQVSEYLLGNFPDGIYFVDLAPRVEGSHLPLALAATLGLRPEAGRDVVDQIAAHLAAKRMLLLLDNCEHLLDAVAPFSEVLLRAAPELHILATSREALGVPGEALFAVQPLRVPSSDRSDDPRTVVQYEAVRLFAERAAAYSPSFRITADNARHVAAICRGVDGIPLALILTAAWANVLTPQQIEARIRDRFRLFRATGSRTTVPRHQTLRATIDWGYALLTESERALLRRLAVFSGGWTLEAAEAVCAGPPVEDTSDALFALSRKSLVMTEETPDGVRYALLETIRQYALEVLQEHGETDAFRARHRDYFAAQATAYGPLLLGSEARVTMEKLDREVDNLRAALAATEDTVTGLHFVASLFWFWHVRGHIREGRPWAERFVRLDDSSVEADPPLLAKALNGAGILAWDEGDLDAAYQHFTNSLEIYRAVDDTESVAGCLSNLGSITGMKRDWQASRTFLLESLLLYRSLGNSIRLASVLGNLGTVAIRLDDLGGASSYLDEALSLQRQLDQPFSMAITLHNLADVAITKRDWAIARKMLAESIQLRRHINNRPGLANGFDKMPLIAEGGGDLANAAILVGFADSLRASVDSPRTDSDAADLESLKRRLRSALGEETYAIKEIQGRHTNVDAAVEIAFGPVEDT